MTYDPVEDDEMLAPQGLSLDVATDDEETDELDGEWQAGHGYPDMRRAVRVWVDEDSRRLTKIRLSTRWRDRLAGRPLGDAIGEAFFLANARAGEVPALTPPDLENPTADPDLTWDDYPRVTDQIQDLMDKVEELQNRDPELVRWADYDGQQVSASSANGNVTVTLSLAGLTDSVDIDKKWVAKARMTDITDAVMSAHQKAYARYVPPTFVPGEHEELAQELAQARAALQTIVSKGI